MAYLEKRGENSWRVEVYLGKDPNTGKRIRHRETIKATSRPGASRKAKIIEGELYKSGTYLDNRDMILENYLNQWLNMRKNKVSPLTFNGYEMIVKKHFIPTLGHIKLKDLKALHLQKYYAEKLEDGRIDGRKGGLSPTTVNKHHRIIRHALQDAIKHELINRNPADLADPPKKEKHSVEILDFDEMKLLLKSAKNHKDYPIIYFALYTGLRRGEILGLQWKDVNFNNKTISIQQALLRNPNGSQPIVSTPKTKSSYRTVRVTQNTLNILKKLKERHRKICNQLNQRPNKEDFVFCRDNNEPIVPDNFSKRFKRLVDRIGLNARFHDLRHTHLTLLLQNNNHPKVAQERAGHSTITTTLDTYSHVTPDMQEEVIAGLERMEDKLDI